MDHIGNSISVRASYVSVRDSSIFFGRYSQPFQSIKVSYHHIGRFSFWASINLYIGCGDCKLKLVDSMLESMRPMMEKRQAIADKPKEVKEILRAGTAKAQKIASATLAEVKACMKI